MPGSSAEYAPDTAPHGCPPASARLLEFGTLSGFALGALLMLGFSLVLSEDSMQSWGWRLPFLVAAPLGLIGMYLRSRMEDTPVFRELEAAGEKEHETRTQFKDLLIG
ncbi:MAG: hypothetical protein WKF76_08480 [Nocardioidaceae bacterium]